MRTRVLCLLAAMGGSSCLAPSGVGQEPIALGTVELKSGTKCITYETSMVPVSGSPNLKGHIENKTGSVLTDVLVKVRPKTPEDGNPPLIGSANVNGAGQPGATGGSIQVKVPLGSKAIQVGATVPASVDLEAPGGTPTTTEFQICFTASVSKAGSAGHYDWTGTCNFNAASGSHEFSLEAVGNDGQAGWIENSDASGNITGFSGTFTFPSGSNITVEGVAFVDADGDAVTATVTSEGTSFSVSQITLRAGARYRFFIDLSGIPEAPTSLSISPAFGP